MIRVRFELLPGGREEGARTIGLMEIANIETRRDGTADYAIILKKTPPFAGALRAAWRKGVLKADDVKIAAIDEGEDADIITARVSGHHRTRRGVYDLAFRALAACGLDKR